MTTKAATICVVVMASELCSSSLTNLRM